MKPSPDWRRWVHAWQPWLVLLIVLAVCYFASYVRYSFNFTDEGGTEALVAQRLLNGEKPFVHVVLGYNVLWFLPIVGLFKLFGVNFVLLRGYCFALSTITAVVGFLTVLRAGARTWLAFLVGVMLVLVPGMTFKNYMPLLAVTNGACLLHYVRAPAGRWRCVVLGGLWLGVTLLIRIDVGLFVSVLWLGAIFLRAFEPGRSRREGAIAGVQSVVIIAALVLACHFPVYVDAKRRGYANAFVQQYSSWPKSLVEQFEQRLSAPPTRAAGIASATPAQPAIVPAVAVAAAPETNATSPVAPASGTSGRTATASAESSTEGGVLVPERDTLQRKGLADWNRAKNREEKALILLLYLPMLSLGLFTLWAIARLARAWWRSEPEYYETALGALVLLGAALTDFPQYYFFRPDAPHLSEFSPGYWIAVAGSLLLLTTGLAAARRRLFLALLGACLVAHAALYLWRMLPDRYTGTIFARKNRKVLFQAENGVRVYVTRHEIAGLKPLQTLIRDHTKRDDLLIAYPYHPALNVMADRRTYERNVYVDNAIAEPDWNAQAIARLERFKPAVVILSDWAINGTEQSRFSVWAEPTKTWIQEHYVYQGTYLMFEVYTRPEK